MASSHFIPSLVLSFSLFGFGSIYASEADSVLADFEDDSLLSGVHTTHPAEVSLVEDVAEAAGKMALKTEVGSDAGAVNHFGTGCNIPVVDLSKASSIEFRIKTDIQSTFNFQAHSNNRVAVFRFSTIGREPGTWLSFTASIEDFVRPVWAENTPDWSSINKFQVTAFGKGPYDGKYLIIDQVGAGGESPDPVPKTTSMEGDSAGPEKRGGPIYLDQPEKVMSAKSPPAGYRSLFDGKTLEGWKAMPRLPVPKYPGAPFKMPLQGEALEAARKNVGLWKVENGAIVGGQDPPGSGRGAYLVSEEKFGDFELVMDMKPDWKTDSGFLVRTTSNGSPGMQVLVDHRPQGGIGGFYGNGIAGIHAMPFAIDARYDEKGNPIGMISAPLDPDRAELNQRTRGLLQYAAEVDDFLSVWKWGDWNTIKIRCEGRIPTLTTWVNGLKISVLEMSTAEWDNYDAEDCFEMLGREGHISLEVHNNNFKHWLGKDRWWPGAVVRWKNIFVRELESTDDLPPQVVVPRDLERKDSDSPSGDKVARNQSALATHIDFSRDVRPILSSKCFKCHGFDANTREAGLRLDVREAAIEMEAIAVGAPDDSSLIDRVLTHDPDDRMPPKGKPLTQDEVGILRAWIEEGAPYEKHWAYVKPEDPRLPRFDDSFSSHISNPIDHFVLAGIESAGLKPAPSADPAVLLRRLSLDLIGLPPSVEEVERFERDPSEESYEREVDRLLASKHFGEKWATTWLDLARFADSNGYQHDDLRSMWPYRDWVINALNDDLPFDQFTIEQLAGDLLPEPTRDQLVATGFHRNVATNFSGGTKLNELRADILHDRVSTTGQVWLGMTLECCQCHDHKFDPVSQVEYFQLYAYFNQSVPEFSLEGPGMFRKKFIGADLPFVTSSENAKRVKEITREIERETAALEKAKSEAIADQTEWEKEFLASDRGDQIPWKRFPWNLRGGLRYLKLPPDERGEEGELNVRALLFFDHPATSPHEKAIDRLKEERDALVARTMVMQDSKQPVPSFLFNRGDYTSLGQRVEPGVPGLLHPLDPELPPNRLGLAKWIVDPDNPLTARVTVNRFWAEIFGRGIVTTVEDFGIQSASPTHPELLDWLALEFIDQGWSMKQLIRTIVMSSTYHRSAMARAGDVSVDPANQWLARGPRFRLSAEGIRDNLLAISGNLSRKIGGPSVYPPQPDGLWKDISGADVNHYPTSQGVDRYRRGLYTFLRRGNPNPMILNFDGSNRSICVTNRDRSNTAVQALNLLNDPCYVDAAHSFALWIENVPGDDRAKAAAAFRRAVSRHPSESELQTIVSLYEAHGSWFSVAQAILNLDETITKS